MDIEKTMQFIVEHQAAFWASLEKSKEEAEQRNKEAEQRHKEAEERHKEAEERHKEVQKRLDKTEENINRIVTVLEHILEADDDRDRRVAERFEEVARLMIEGREAQRATNERLDALIHIVDGMIRGGWPQTPPAS